MRLVHRPPFVLLCTPRFVTTEWECTAVMPAPLYCLPPCTACSLVLLCAAYSQVRDYKVGTSRADLEEARAAARAQQGLEPDSDEVRDGKYVGFGFATAWNSQIELQQGLQPVRC